MGRVYISLPLARASGKGGREVLRGVELALEGAAPEPVPVTLLDSSGPDREAQATTNARLAAADKGALYSPHARG